MNRPNPPRPAIASHDLALMGRPDVLKAIETADNHPELLVRHPRPNID